MMALDKAAQIAVREATPAEARRCAEIVVEAYASLPSTDLMFPHEEETREIMLNGRLHQFSAQLEAHQRDHADQPDPPSRHGSARPGKPTLTHYLVACHASEGQEAVPVALLRWGIKYIGEEEQFDQWAQAIKADVHEMAQHWDKDHFDQDLFHCFALQTSQAHFDLYRGKGEHAVVHTVATLPAYQGCGVGAQLMQRFVEQVDQLGVEAYLEATEGGQRLYRRFGFTDVKRSEVRSDDGAKSFPLTLMMRPARRKTETVQ